MTVGDFLGNIVGIVRRANDPDFAARVRALMRKHYYSIAAKQSWLLMRGELSLAFSGTTENKLWLPSNLIGIDRVHDRTNDVEFYPRDRHDVDVDEDGYRYATWRGSSSPLFSGEGAVSGGSTSFTCSALTTDYTGYWVTFGTDECFLLTGQLTFAPAYNGPSLSDADIVIRPVKTLAMALYDSAEDAAKFDVTVYHWSLPPQLWLDSDDILLPEAGWLELLVLRDLPEAKERRPVNQREIAEAEARCMSMNPSFPRTRHPRDRINKPIRLSTSHFGRR